ncbi:MAG: acetolactate decarboxylase [Cyclobacteriaceae bacterium]
MKIYTLIMFLLVPFAYAQPVVKHAGAMSTMGAENFKGNILLDTLTKNNLYGLGPYGKMQGEITIVNGKPLIAEALADGSARVSQTWKAEAPFFVYQQVPEWTSYEFKSKVNDLNDLQTAIEAIANQKGYDLSIPFAFRIVGTIPMLTTHIVTPRSPDVPGYQAGKNQINYTLTHTKGELIGFYSQHHQGVYTHKSSNIHIHFVSHDFTQMGHVDKISLSDETYMLMFPTRGLTTGSLKIKTNDTDFSKGRLGHIQEVTLDDVAKFHGHLCDGLVVGFLGLEQALLKLYPDGIVDRTNTRIVSNASPCLTDVAVYLTGGRYQFNTFYVDNKINEMFYVSRIDTKLTYTIKLKPGIKPAQIDSLGNLAVGKKLSGCDLDHLRLIEDQFTAKLLDQNSAELFDIVQVNDFRWKPKLNNKFVKTDVINKGAAPCRK